MTCNCDAKYDECDGKWAVAYPLQEGASCAVVRCCKQSFDNNPYPSDKDNGLHSDWAKGKY